MKTRYALFICLMTGCMMSCQKEDVGPIQETGTLHIDIGLFIRITEVNSTLKSTQQTEDFRVIIYRTDNEEVMSFENASEMPAVIELETGDYYVEAHSDNNLPAAFDNPYYYGRSEVFSITGNEQQSVLVSCALANTMVTIIYSERIRNSFTDYVTIVSSDLGSLVFLKDEIRSGYFQPLPLDIRVELTYLKTNGLPDNKILSGSIPEPIAGRHYEVHVDASIDEGMASFQILLDETEPEVEVIGLTDDTGSQNNGSIRYGELLITEIMYDPASLPDSEGEWFEVYNNSDHSINFRNLILGRNDVDRHVITDAVELLPGAYFVFERTMLATDAGGYVYGSDISLTNTGSVLAIYNEGTADEPGALIFSVDYGGEFFPSGSGASICLNPDLINADDAIHGSSWCTSASVYSTGDRGTPGMVNDLCNP
ncbi:MAG: DUF4493 domain-containing protein [Bacteroidales bacterium]|nr:DUF4493 domain-containing protein [Bacteroidales bacterium]